MGPKELQAVMKLCRKFGVSFFQSPNLTMKFGDLPKDSADDSEDIETEGLTPEQLMFFSADAGQ